MSGVFISYRREDSAYVAMILRDKLTALLGSGGVFVDIDSIPLGVDFRTHIAEALAQCGVMLVVVGNRWVGFDASTGKRRIDDANDYVRIEVETAMSRGIAVIPVLVDSAHLPAKDELPSSLETLRFRNAAEIRPGHHATAQFDSLCTEVIRQLGEHAHQTPSTSSEVVNALPRPSFFAANKPTVFSVIAVLATGSVVVGLSVARRPAPPETTDVGPANSPMVAASAVTSASTSIPDTGPLTAPRKQVEPAASAATTSAEGFAREVTQPATRLYVKVANASCRKTAEGYHLFTFAGTASVAPGMFFRVSPDLSYGWAKTEMKCPSWNVNLDGEYCGRASGQPSAIHWTATNLNKDAHINPNQKVELLAQVKRTLDPKHFGVVDEFRSDVICR